MAATTWEKLVRIWIDMERAYRHSSVEKLIKAPTKPISDMDIVRLNPFLILKLGYASFPSGQIIIGEYKEGKRDGKMTVYGTNGTVKNKIKEQGDTV